MLDFEEHRKKQKEQRATQTLIDNYYKNNVKPKAKKTTTTSSKKKKQNDDGFFKKSNGGFWSTLGASTLDAGGNLIEGSLNAFEGISDWTRYRGADVLDFFGADKKANEIRKIADEDTTSGIVSDWNHITAGDLAGKKSEEEIGHFKSVEENSIFGNKADSVFQGVGNSLTGAAVGSYLGAPVTSQRAKNLIGMTSFGVSATGGAEEEAIANGATRDEARLYGALSGTVEAGSEMLFGGLGKVNQALGFSKGALDDVIVNNFTRNMKNSLLRNITTLGIKSIGEGFEEVTAGFGNALAQKLTYMNEEDFKTLLKDQKLMDSFVSGMLSSAIMQSPSTVRYSVQGRDVNTGLTGTQRKYVNEIAQQRMVEAQKRNAKLNGYEKSKIEQRAVTDFQQGRLADANKLQQVNLPGLSTKDMDLQQSAYKYGFNPNSEAIVTAKTMLDNRGIKSRFDADAFKNINGNAYWTNKNGVREVVFNPNASEQAILEEIAIHELTHDLMSSENSKTTLNKQNIIDYVSTLDGYKESRTKLEKLYANQTKGMSKQKANALINEEIIADTLGKNIGSQEYIRRLIDDEPSIAKNIYDWVVNKVANKSGVKNEKAYWNNVKNNFEKAYNMEYQGKGSNTKYSIGGKKGIDNVDLNINKEFTQYVEKAKNSYDKALGMAQNGYTNEQIRNETKWYQDRNGDWKFEFTDKDFNLKIEPKNIEVDKVYKLGDLVEHKFLNALYPEIMNYDVKFTKKRSQGSFYKDTKSIEINQNKLTQKNAKDSIEGTLIHEIQHAIQQIEGFEGGRTSKLSKQYYYESLGEAEATDTRTRMELEKKGRLNRENTPPLSFYKDAKHPNYENYMENRGIIDKIKDSLYSFITRGGTDEVFQEVDKENQKQNRTLVDGRRRIELDNSSFFNEETRYSLSEDASIEDKINASMTMAEAKKMIQIAFQENRINDWREDGEKYVDGDDWLNDVGVDEVASYIDNTHSTILNYTNPLYDKNIGFGEDYYTENILEAYQNGTLTGMPKEQATRLDTSISNDYQDDRFYSPREVQTTLELYNKANQRVTKTNSAEVYKARADFIIATHQKGVAEQLGLTQQEINKKIKSWANYTEKARNLSNQLNENVSLQNRWSGLENSSIVNTISVTNEELGKMVKEIKGDSGEWQRQYITSTMLALDTHIDYSKLTFEFDQNQALREEHALGDYNRRTKTIRIGDGHQNTVAHEIGHYIDNKWAEDFGFLETSNLTDGLNFESTTLSNEAKQFNKNFQTFMNDLVKSATIGYGSKTNYYQSRSETFARFVGRFVEWTKNQATNNRYGYESKYYEENFTESQYREFVKILQEKAMLDTTMNVEKRHSQQNEGWQSFLDNNFEAKGTKTRLSDIKLPSLTNAVQQEVQKQTSNALLPIANELKELNKNLTKVMNPLEISQLTPQDANTTPNLPGINRNKVGDGKSKFFDNIKDKTNMLNDEQKTAILNNDDVKYYDKVTNKDSLDKAFERLQENGQSESLRWFNKASENADATDVAEGWILLKQYADSGDTNGMVEVAKKLRDMGTKAGQTVQAFNIMSRLTPEGMVKYAQSELLEAYDNMVKNKSAKWIEENRSKFDLQPNEVQFIMDTMREVSTMEDGYDKRFKLAQIQKVLTDKLPPAKGAGMKSWMRISMLFNPKTQVRNVAGNALIAPINAFGDMFASGVDKLVSAKTGIRTTGNTNWKNYAKGMKTGLYQSYNDFKNGVNTRNIEGNRFEVTEGKSFKERTIIGKSLNNVDRLLSFMLDAGDRGFYEASFVNSINNQMVLNNTTEVTQEMIDIATQEALSRTWQDNNEYTKFVLGIRKSMNKINIGGYGLGDVLIPFAKTPANLTKALIDYSPAGLIGTINKGIKLNRSLTNGQYSAKTQHEFVQSLGKATAGTMLYIIGYALAKAGITTGESDEDKDVANFMKNTLGVNSYSIKIGDMTFTYDWAQPIAAPLAMTANMVQKEKEGATLGENIVSTLDTAGNLLLEQSFMESINTVLNNNEGIATGIQEAIFDLPSRAVPTFLKQITDMVDGTQRQTFVKDKPFESMFNSVKAKIPGLSQTLAPSVDTLGREIQKYGGKNNLFNVFLNPANVNTENVSESAQEIYRLYKETGETNIMPRVAPYYVNKKGDKIVLTTQQRTQYQKVSGKIIEENVSNLLESTAYKNMSDTKKTEVISDIVNYSYNIAQKEVLGTELSDTYEKAYEYSQIGDISDYYEFRNSIDDTNSKTERESVFNYLYNSDLDDNQIAKLYRSCNYSTDKKINAMLELRIPMKEFVKYDTAEIEGKYNPNTGKTISGSKKNAIIEYVNTLNLSKAQKAILIKGTNTFNFNEYNNDIIRYVNALPGTVNEKKVLLKSIGFDNYDKDVVNYILSQNISAEEKLTKLDELGFTVRDGRVYY